MPKKRSIHPDYVDTHAILLMAPVDWDQYVSQLNLRERGEVERAIASDCVKLARFAAYVARRLGGGRHSDAVKSQNKTARKVRQALGYTYPDDPLQF